MHWIIARPLAFAASFAVAGGFSPAPQGPADPPIVAVTSTELPDWEALAPERARLAPSARRAFDSSVVAAFDSLIAVRLTRAGLRVVPGTEVDVIWRRLVDSVQGFYDPLTGELVEAEYFAVVTGTARALHARHGAVRWLRPTIAPVEVVFDKGKAEWHGVTERIGGRNTGRGAALSVVIEVLDTAGRALTSSRGGLRLLFRVDVNGISTDVAWNTLYGDPRRNDRAVALALDPLIAGLGGHATGRR
jgi:hypothetical protein